MTHARDNRILTINSGSSSLKVALFLMGFGKETSKISDECDKSLIKIVFLSYGERLSFRDRHGREGMGVVARAKSYFWYCLPAASKSGEKSFNTLKHQARTKARIKVPEISGFAEFLHRSVVT